MNFKLESVLNKTPAQREEELNQHGNQAAEKLDVIMEYIINSDPRNALTVDTIENIVLA